jgi:hypothetical protein
MLYKLLNWYKQYKLDLIAAEAAAANKPFEAVMAVAQQQSQFMEKWLDSWKGTEVPSSTVVRDLDEWHAEQARLRQEQGDNLSPELRQSIENAIRGGALGDLREML